MTIAERIFKIIDERNISQKVFSESIGANEKTVSTWRKLGRKPPVELIVPIAHELGVSLEYLLTGEDADISDLCYTVDEKMLIDKYRQLNGKQQKHILQYAENLAKLSKLESK